MPKADKQNPGECERKNYSSPLNTKAFSTNPVWRNLEQAALFEYHLFCPRLHYASFVSLVFFGFIYSCCIAPFTYLLFCFFAGYLLSQYWWMVGHVAAHAVFVSFPEAAQLPLGLQLEYAHHHVNTRALSDHWLQYRVANLSFNNPITGSATAAILWILFYNQPFPIEASLPFVSCFFLTRLAQEPIHEWYHLPKHQRPGYFWFPYNHLYNFLDYLGIISEKKHLHQHHNHTKQNLKEAYFFFDIPWLMEPLNKLSDKLWQFGLKFSAPGGIVMAIPWLMMFILAPLAGRFFCSKQQNKCRKTFFFSRLKSLF